MNTDFALHPQLAKDCIEIVDLPLCKLLLCNDSNYPWFILVPKVKNATDIYLLSDDQQQQLFKESKILSEVIMTEFKGDKLNVAAIGNMVPQLHVHHVVRYKSDISWPKPIWGQHPLENYTASECDSLIKNIKFQLSLKF